MGFFWDMLLKKSSNLMYKYQYRDKLQQYKTYSKMCQQPDTDHKFEILNKLIVKPRLEMMEKKNALEKIHRKNKMTMEEEIERMKKFINNTDTDLERLEKLESEALLEDKKLQKIGDNFEKAKKRLDFLDNFYNKFFGHKVYMDTTRKVVGYDTLAEPWPLRKVTIYEYEVKLLVLTSRDKPVNWFSYVIKAYFLGDTKQSPTGKQYVVTISPRFSFNENDYNVFKSNLVGINQNYPDFDLLKERFNSIIISDNLDIHTYNHDEVIEIIREDALAGKETALILEVEKSNKLFSEVNISNKISIEEEVI